MYGIPTLAPTRTNLLRTRQRLNDVRKGMDLLHKKREALVVELFRHARPAVDARAHAMEHARRAWPALLNALAMHGHAGVRALGWPGRVESVVLQPGLLWGVPIALLLRRPSLRRTLEARGTAPALTGPATIEAAGRFETFVETLLEAASREFVIRRLGDALARTSRQVNTLEHRLAPALRAQIAAMEHTLEEREHEEHLRWRHLLYRRSQTLQVHESETNSQQVRKPTGVVP